MYLYETHEGKEAKEFVNRRLPSGGEWPEVACEVQRVEVWASNIDDSGADHYVLVAIDADGEEIGRKRIRAY